MTDHPDALIKRIKTFSAPDDKKAVLEISLTFAILVASTAGMMYGLPRGWYASLLLMPFAGFMVTRLFTIQHDCGHGSYFTSRRVNNIVGTVLGMFTLAPYHYWKKTHTVHHAFSGNLDRRGVGDFDTLTVKEYQALPPLRKAWYRIYRHPAFVLIIAPFMLFGVKFRLPLDNPFHTVKIWSGIMATNIGIAAVFAGVVYFCGWHAFWTVYQPVVWLGSALGVAGFYIHHQYEDTYWNSADEWTYFDAGMHGSSYFEFPAVINWAVNNINLHHIHHLNGNVPSYRLRECLANIPALRDVPKRTLKDVPGCFRLALWDDETKKMVRFS